MQNGTLTCKNILRIVTSVPNQKFTTQAIAYSGQASDS